MPRLRCLPIISGLIFGIILHWHGFAQPYSSQPMKFVVPFPPGGAVDVLARTVGQIVSTSTGQTIVVENRPGGFTLIAANAVAAAEPDGHTFLFTSGRRKRAAVGSHWFEIKRISTCYLRWSYSDARGCKPINTKFCK